MSILDDNRIIAAVRKKNEFEKALISPVRVIFLLSSDVLSLKFRADAAHLKNKTLFMHIDFCSGLGNDRYGLEYVKRAGLDGIISTKTGVIETAKEAGLSTVQRFFIIDSLSVSTALGAIERAEPDFIELMPGIIAPAISGFAAKVSIPLIAGGLIQDETQARNALKAGAAAVSTSCAALWNGKY